MSKGVLCPCTHPSLWLFSWPADVSSSLSLFCSDIASLTSFSYSPFFLTDFTLWSPYPTTSSFYFLFDKTHQPPCFSSLSSWSSLDIYLLFWSFLARTEERDGFLLSVDLAVCGHRRHQSQGILLQVLKASARKSWVGKNAEGINYSVEIMQLACKR